MPECVKTIIKDYINVTKIKKNYFKFRRCVEDIQTQREYCTPIILPTFMA